MKKMLKINLMAGKIILIYIVKVTMNLQMKRKNLFNF